MSLFGRAFHAENENHPVFRDFLAGELMTAEEYTAVQGYILGGARFFEPETDPETLTPKELLRQLVNTPFSVCTATSPRLRSSIIRWACAVRQQAANIDNSNFFFMILSLMNGSFFTVCFLI